MHLMIQNDLKHLTAQSTLYTLNTHPRAKISPSFSVRPAIFTIQSCRKSEMHRMTPEMTLSTYLTKVPCIPWILTHNAQISLCFTLRTAVFEIQGFDNWKCTEWPQNDLKHLTVKSTLYTQNTHPQSQISLRFPLRLPISKILAIFQFPFPVLNFNLF